MRLRFLGVKSAINDHRNSNMYDSNLHTTAKFYNTIELTKVLCDAINIFCDYSDTSRSTECTGKWNSSLWHILKRTPKEMSIHCTTTEKTTL